MLKCDMELSSIICQGRVLQVTADLLASRALKETAGLKASRALKEDSLLLTLRRPEAAKFIRAIALRTFTEISHPGPSKILRITLCF